jgi:hypothetical protein
MHLLGLADDSENRDRLVSGDDQLETGPSSLDQPCPGRRDTESPRPECRLVGSWRHLAGQAEMRRARAALAQRCLTA